MVSCQSIGLQICEQQHLLWGLEYVNRTYFGLLEAPGNLAATYFPHHCKSSSQGSSRYSALKLTSRCWQSCARKSVSPEIWHKISWRFWVKMLLKLCMTCSNQVDSETVQNVTFGTSTDPLFRPLEIAFKSTPNHECK